MDYQQYNSLRSAPTYPSYTSTSGFNQHDNHRDQRYIDSYGRSTANPLPTIFRTAAATSNSPRAQPFSYRPSSSNPVYDVPRNYNADMSSGYISDTNDLRRSSISIRSLGGTKPTARNVTNTNNNNQQSYYSPSPVTYNTKITTSNDQNYYSDSEYVTSGPRYTKISRQANTTRRPSNVVLPIRSITSKAYDEYVPPEPPKPQQQPVDVYRYQREQQQRLEREQREQREREQRERERQEQFQRKLYQQQQAAAAAAAAAAARFRPPQLTFPSQEQRRKSDTTIDHELGAELLKSPIANKKRYADSTFFSTPFNTYPTIEEQKKMARKIASILEGGDPTEKGTSKFEKQRQRAEKYTLEAEPTTPTLNTSNYRPLRPLQPNGSSFNHQQPYYDSFDIPECIKHSIDEAQHSNTLRLVGAPEDFKQIHMQEHVTHTDFPPQVAMSLVADLNQNRGKGAALFQKRKARSEKWVIDENNVKKSSYQPTSSYIGPTSKPWGQHAPTTWSGDEKPYAGPNFSPIRPKFKPPSTSSVSESILSPPPTQNVPKYGDFNAKPKGFGAWNAENAASQTPRGSIDSRKPLNLSIEPSIREGIAESHTRTSSQPWSPTFNTQSILSPNQQQSNDYFNYPSENTLAKWKNQEYSPWNQQRVQDQQQSQIPMTREGVDQLRQRLMQQNQSSIDQSHKQYSTYNQRSGNSNAPTNYNNPYSSSQGSIQQQHFTDL
jgi:hypothetical protein